MLIIGTFEHSIELEQFLAILEHSGVPRDCILVVPMDTNPTSSILANNRPGDRYSKAIEVGMACATGCSVIGTSIGFILTWGPIIWGLIIAAIGFIIGFGVYLLTNRATSRHLSKKLPEVIVIVQCLEEHASLVVESMWEHLALTVGRFTEPS